MGKFLEKVKSNKMLGEIKKNFDFHEFGLGETKASEEDLRFVNTLYAQSQVRIRKNVYLLFLAIISLVVISIIWATFAEIDELARGEGKVIPSAKIQTIQSLDGGVISEILVKEGSIVKKNQPLIKVDTTRFKASLDENKNALEDLLAARVRLKEEKNIDLSKPMPILDFEKLNLDEHPDIIRLQTDIFNTKYTTLKSEIKTLTIQVNQKKQELLEIKSKVKQLTASKVLLDQEVDTVKKLVEKRAKSKMELFSLLRESNKVSGDLESAQLSIPRSKLSIEESENKILERMNSFKSEAAKELQEINSEIKRFTSKVISEKDKLDKTVIVSPVNGIIKQIHLNTVGGVVRSGADLIEIVPESDILLVEAKIDPKDIAFISPAQKAIVKITAYDFSIYGGLEGKITEISADSLKDEDSKDGKTYYKVVIQTTKNYLEKDGQKHAIIPGMISSVDIITGKKTILDFILKPILKTQQSAFHER